MLSLHVDETRANRNAAPLGARSQQITLNASPAQESALAAFAGDRGISQGDALLLRATMTMNSEPNLSEPADWVADLSAAGRPNLWPNNLTQGRICCHFALPLSNSETITTCYARWWTPQDSNL